MNLRTFSLVGLISTWLAIFPLTVFSADPLANPIQERDLDLTACQTFSASGTLSATLDDVTGALGLIVPKYPGWVAGAPAKPGEPETFQYRIAFVRQIPLGAIYLPNQYSLRLLKPDAPYPGDPTNDAHWFAPTVQKQAGGTLFTLDNHTQTRAVLFAHSARGRSNLQGVRLYTSRVLNATPAAQAYAAEEYTPPNTDHSTHPASALITGINHWESVGKDMSGRVPRAPVSDLFPTWLLLAWHEPQSLSGLVLDSNFEKFAVEVYQGPEGVHPKAATAEEWRRLEVSVGPVIPSASKHAWRYISFAPVTSRGLRLVTTKTAEGPVASVMALHALTNLGNQSIPARSMSVESAPVEIKLPLQEAANLTLGVNGPDGRRLRNLVVRSPREAGEQNIGWDLKDGEGQFVPPGKYPWKAIVYPDLQTRYEMTVYPNVSRYAPGNSPWLNALNGSGGWMADHSPPVSGCAAGDHVYLGSYVAESGVSLIEADLAGQKTWGHHSFAAWTGPQYLASDGKEVFVGANILNTSNESVWAVDIATKEVRRALSLVPSSTRPRGLRGLAVYQGKIYLACRGVQNYLTNAASADDVDVSKCVPYYPPARAPRVAYEIVPDPRTDFLRLFRLTGTPPGGATQYTSDWLRAQSGPSAQQHIVLAFQSPVAIGSLAFPRPESKNTRALISVLKPNASYPPDPERQEIWTVLPEQAKQPWDVIPMPPGTQTRALRITFARGAAGESDPLATLLESPKTKTSDFDALDRKTPTKDDEVLGFGSSVGKWQGQIEGIKLLRRRLVNVAGQAKVQVNSGKLMADGAWDAERSRPLTEEDPGIYLLKWQSPQSLRGLAIKEIDGELTKIDVYTGTDAQNVDLRGKDGWETVAEYRQERRDHHSGFASCNGTARYMDGYVDFGSDISTSAVRLRVVKQWTDNLPDSRGIRADLGGTKLDPARCRIFGVAALKYIGGETPIDAAAFERVEVYDVKSGALLGETPLKQPGQLATLPNGDVLAISSATIVRVDFSKSEHRPLITDLTEPTALTVDSQGNVYVFDNAPQRRQVRVYSPTGSFVRAIGKPGGLITGAWNQERLGTVSALAVDQRNQLWVVENQYHPKRITVWSTQGELIREHLGNTPYGGGGVLDPLDKNRLFYGPMEFELDWKTGLSRIKYLHWLGQTPPGEMPLVIEGRNYLVTRPEFAEQAIGVVYRYEQGQAQLVAAMGQADKFAPLKETSLLNQLGNKPLAQSSFLWTDVNGDGQVQAAEVQIADAPRREGLTLFNRDLSIQAGSTRYQMQGFQSNGVPRYEIVKNPKVDGVVYRLDNGNYHRMGDNRIREAGVREDGSTVWNYVVEGPGVQPLQTAKPWRRDQVISQFGIVGHENLGDQGLGEFVVIHGNLGSWNIWTHDGLLVGPLFRDLRDPLAKPWSMKTHDRGMLLENMTIGQEHFHGYFCQNKQDGKYYAVAGHNHVSVLEVQGLDRAQRINGLIEVTHEDLQRAQQWDQRREQLAVYQRAPVIDAYRLTKPPLLDGRLSGWGPPDAAISGLEDDYRSRTGAEFRIGYDAQSLYLAWRVHGLGPLKNTGEQWERLFKTGASVDLQLAINSDASINRQAPEQGDLRLLLTFVGDKPMAILYEPIVPGARPEDRVRVTSPTGEVTFDEIKRLDNVRLVRSGDDQQYTIEAAIPLAALGLKPTSGMRLKMDWGVLVTGPDGNEVMRRIYWSNKATSIVADAPSEARLQPHLWGHVRFHDERPSAERQLDPLASENKEKKKSFDDLLDGPTATKKP
jgi:hypothetical protein